jgi:hypothetical protein
MVAAVLIVVGGPPDAMSPTRLRRREPSQSLRDAEYQDHITLARAVEAIVDRRVRELLGSRADDDYSSDRLPPGIATRKAFARICASGIIAWRDGLARRRDSIPRHLRPQRREPLSLLLRLLRHPIGLELRDEALEARDVIGAPLLGRRPLVEFATGADAHARMRPRVVS